MKVCNGCEGFIPLKSKDCPNCGAKVSAKEFRIPQIVSGLASLSISMTLMACYGQPPSRSDSSGTGSLALLVSLSSVRNYSLIVFTGPKNLGELTIELDGRKFQLSPEKRSQSVVIYERFYHYRITDSSNRVLYENRKFDFGENCKDGVFVKVDSKIPYNDSKVCYNLNGITGLLDSLNCSEFH